MSSYVVQKSNWRGRSLMLPALDVELTERCQNNCIHCCINIPSDSPAIQRELSTEQLKCILKEAADLGCLQLRFTGGEVLLRTDFEELYVFTRRLGMKVMLFTNARMITPSLADLLARMPPLFPVEISVYGMTASSYDMATRTPGSFAEFRRGIDLLLSRGVPFLLKWVELPPNREEITEFKAWISTLPWTGHLLGTGMFFQLRCRREDMVKNRMIANLRPHPPKVESLEGMDRFCRKFLGPPGDRMFSCCIGEKPCVNAYGQLQPCINMRAPELCYDLLSGSLYDALVSFHKLKELRVTHSEYLRRCARCFLKSLCDQCPALSWTESGMFDFPIEYLCHATHAQARSLGLIRDEEQGWLVKDWKNRIDS